MTRRPSRWKLWILSGVILIGAALGLPPVARAAAGADARPADSPIAVTADPAGALSPAVAGDPMGNFAVVWSGRELADFTSSVLLRRFDAAGHPLGAEIAVASGVKAVGGPRIAIGSDGGMVVVWSDFWVIRARRLTADGQPVGSVIAVSPLDYHFHDAPDVAVLRAGGFAVVWHTYADSVFEPVWPTSDLLARVFDAQGTAQGDAFPMSLEVGDRSQARVAADPAGGFAIAWQDSAGDVSAGAPLQTLRFAADGTPRGSQVEVTAGPGSFSPVPLFTAGGELSVVWANLGGDSFFNPAGLFAQRFAADGSLLGSQLKLADGPVLGTPPDVAQDRLGHRLLVWGAPNGGVDPRLATEIRSRLFDSTWQPLQAPLRAALLTPRALDYAGHLYSIPPWPAVASGSAGFLAVWDGRPTPPSPSPAEIRAPQVTGQILAGDCVGGTGTLCLQQDRFEVSVAWKDPRSGATGTATAIPLSGDTGAFWFFSPGNAELLVKVLDGRPVNGRWWVFFGALTDLQYDVTVTDTRNGLLRVYHNPPYVFASRADVDAFSDNGVPAPVALPLPRKAAVSEAVSGGCPAGACLGAFQVSIEWIDPKTGAAHQAAGVPLSADSAAFWFFDANNIELIVKVLDGHAVNGHWWVFYGALTDVEYTLRVDWPDQHISRSYHNPAHHMESHGDTQAFP